MAGSGFPNSAIPEASLAVKLVILDRDGVINEDSDAYIKSPDEWVPIPGSLDAIAQLNRADYRVVVASNQSGVARGLFDLTTLNRINNKMCQAVINSGGSLDAVFFCPHAPDDGCDCRKPRPGLLEDIARRLQTDLTSVPVIGDSLRDLEAALAVGAQPILVRTGKGALTEARLDSHSGIPVFDDLQQAVQYLLDKE